MATWLIIVIGIISLIAGIWLMKKIVDIFKGRDGVFSVAEFLKMTGSVTLQGLCIYMIIKEANRAEEWQLFGPTYIFLVIGGYLAIIGLEKVLYAVMNVFGKTPPKEEDDDRQDI